MVSLQLDPFAVTTKADLRNFLLKILTEWLPKLVGNQIPVRIPRLTGLRRMIPGMHFHLRPELFLQISGETAFQFPEEEFKLRPGEICLMPKGMPHREKVRSWRGSFSNLVFVYRGPQILIHLAEEKPQGRPSMRASSRICQNVDPALTVLLEQACELAQTSSEVRFIGIKSLMAAHLVLIQTSLEGWDRHSDPEPVKITQTRQLVTKLLSSSELSVGYLARQLQCRPDYLSRLFRATTGTPLAAYISEHRFQRARELLQFSFLNVAEVSRAAGFRDPSYFTRAFHRWAGMTPREMRKNFREISPLSQNKSLRQGPETFGQF